MWECQDIFQQQVFWQEEMDRNLPGFRIFHVFLIFRHSGRYVPIEMGDRMSGLEKVIDGVMEENPYLSGRNGMGFPSFRENVESRRHEKRMG